MRKHSINDPACFSQTVVINARESEALDKHDLKTAASRFLSCDWGEVSESLWRQNDEAYKAGGQIIGRYISVNGELFQIISEAGKEEAKEFLPGYYKKKRAC